MCKIIEGRMELFQFNSMLIKFQIIHTNSKPINSTSKLLRPLNTIKLLKHIEIRIFINVTIQLSGNKPLFSNPITF